ncbi:hypothetical protein [Curtobacterium oceanosedimentum]|uniref:hypothetical protein n=1 Tax=Curtobacterium oceanosedimentum TaxID=465820 RepID=UPI00137B54F6|nr:hypothetical protein [Curtobacterium oceanosedimentum]
MATNTAMRTMRNQTNESADARLMTCDPMIPTERRVNCAVAIGRVTASTRA